MTELANDLMRNLEELTALEQEINEYWRPWIEQSIAPVPERLQEELFRIYKKLRHDDKYEPEEIMHFAAEVGSYWNEDAYDETGFRYGPSGMNPDDTDDFNRLNEIIREIDTGYLTESDVKRFDSWFQSVRRGVRSTRQPNWKLQNLVHHISEGLNSISGRVTDGRVWGALQDHFRKRTSDERELDSYFYTVSFEPEDNPSLMHWEDKDGNRHPPIAKSSLKPYVRLAKNKLGI